MRLPSESQSRILFGTLANIIVIVGFLKLGDSIDPIAMPSHIILGSPVWLVGVSWWAGSGLISGLIATLASVRAHDRSMEIGLPIIFFSSAIAALILALVALINYQEVSATNVLLVGLLYIVFYVILSFFPALFSLAFFNAISGFVEGIFTKSTAATIMPPELRRSYEAEQTRIRQLPLYKRLLHR